VCVSPYSPVDDAFDHGLDGRAPEVVHGGKPSAAAGGRRKPTRPAFEVHVHLVRGVHHRRGPLGWSLMCCSQVGVAMAQRVGSSSNSGR
jgi:hypothetical protein